MLKETEQKAFFDNIKLTKSIESIDKILLRIRVQLTECVLHFT